MNKGPWPLTSANPGIVEKLREHPPMPIQPGPLQGLLGGGILRHSDTGAIDEEMQGQGGWPMGSPNDVGLSVLNNLF